MFSELWIDLGGSLDRRWLRNLLIPALVFCGGGLWIWMQITGVDQALAKWNAYPSPQQVLLGAAGLMAVLGTTMLLEASARPLLRLNEGYGLEWTGLAQRRKRSLMKLLNRRQELRVKVALEQAAAAERLELSRIDSELVHRPRNPDRTMPTRLGDILRSAEDYPRDRYGLDPIVFWPRLFPLMREPLREALSQTQDQLSLALRLATLSALYGAIGSIAVAFERAWPVLWWTLPALPTAWLFWRWAYQPAASYAGLLRSAFDLHRFDIYEAMHWPQPASPQGERDHGRELTIYVLEGAGAKDIRYTEPWRTPER